MSDLLLDAKLNQASYDNAYRNGGTGAPVAGWQPITVDKFKATTTNFSAQLFKEANGTYKLAYRGTSDWGAGDVAINNALTMGYWSDEMTDAIKFTYAAIQSIQTETGKSFDAARRLLAVTGHSQGGSEAELAAKFFGLAGTSLDGPGVSAQVRSQAWNLLKAELMRQQPDLQANYTLTGFLARRYTFAVGSIGSHLSDVRQDNAALWLIGQTLPMLTGPVGIGISVGGQALGFHRIQSIIDWEAARQKSPLLRWISEADDPLAPVSSQPQNVAGTIAGEMNAVNVAGPGSAPPPGVLEARSAQIAEFLAAHPGGIQYRINNGTALIEAGNGDTLLLRQDGSGMRLTQDGLGGLVQENLGLNGAILESMAFAPLSDTETLVTITSAGQTITKVVSTQTDGSLGVEERDADGNLLSESTVHTLGTDENGQLRYGLDQTRYAGGQAQSTTTSTLNAAGQLQMTVERRIDGHQVKVEFIEDEWGELQASRVVSVDGQAIDGDSAFDDLLNHQGYDVWGFADGDTPPGSAPLDALFKAHNPLEKQGLQTLVTALTRTADALSLLSAIQSGKPLPILASGLRLANAIPGAANDAARAGFNLSGVSNAVSGVLSLMSLDQALKNGDAIGAITAGAQALSFGASAWVDFAAQNVLTATTFEATAGAHVAFDGAVGFQQGVGKALPALNIINSLAHGDYVGAAVYTIAAYAFPPLGVAYTVFNLIKGLFGGGDEPQPWGTGHWAWGATGIQSQVAGGAGGEGRIGQVMDALQQVMAAIQAQTQPLHPDIRLGWVPQRLPSLGFADGLYHLAQLDPLTGAVRHPELRYRPQDMAASGGQPGTEEAGWDLTTRFIHAAIDAQALTSQWEADTMRQQSERDDPLAGLTEEARAGRNGHLAAGQTTLPDTYRQTLAVKTRQARHCA